MYNIRKATLLDKEEILKLYQSLIGTDGCTWHLEYPCMDDIIKDIKKDSLYVLLNKEEKIIAAGAAGKDNELELLDCWNSDIKNPCDLARIGVLESYQGRGLAKKIIQFIEKDVKNRGFDGIHFMVSKTNPKAISLYNHLGYKNVGETEMYDREWFCYEKNLSEMVKE